MQLLAPPQPQSKLAEGLLKVCPHSPILQRPKHPGITFSRTTTKAQPPPYVWLSILSMSPLVSTFLNMERPSDCKGVGGVKEQYFLKSVYDAKAANSLIGPRWCWPPTQVWTELNSLLLVVELLEEFLKMTPLEKTAFYQVSLMTDN